MDGVLVQAENKEFYKECHKDHSIVDDVLATASKRYVKVGVTKDNIWTVLKGFWHKQGAQVTWVLKDESRASSFEQVVDAWKGHQRADSKPAAGGASTGSQSAKRPAAAGLEVSPARQSPQRAAKVAVTSQIQEQLHRMNRQQQNDRVAEALGTAAKTAYKAGNYQQAAHMGAAAAGMQSGEAPPAQHELQQPAEQAAKEQHLKELQQVEWSVQVLLCRLKIQDLQTATEMWTSTEIGQRKRLQDSAAELRRAQERLADEEQKTAAMLQMMKDKEERVRVLRAKVEALEKSRREAQAPAAPAAASPSTTLC